MNYKKLIITTTCSFLLFLGTASAQNFAGIATYKSASKMSFSMDSTHTSSSEQEMMQAQLSKAMQKEYDLKFTVSESSWSEVESLDGPAAAGGMMVMTFGGANGLLYKNIQEGKFERESNIFGKPFLVKDKMERTKWKLTNETKQIGEYTCQKATYERIVEARRMVMFGADEEKEDKPEEEAPVEMDTIIVTAWYTPEIPVSHGPSEYWGLPGLILEVNNGGTTLICSKIVLNPSEGIEIAKPEKGKVVTQAEFDVVQAEKMEEMMKKYSGGQSGGMEFRIGNQ